MRVRIVYVHHNGFVLHLDKRTFLFDYPADEHLPPGAEALVRREVAGTDLYVLVSHSHADHFNPGLARVVEGARHVSWIVSDDVAEMHPRVLPRDVLLLGPDERHDFMGMTIGTLMANDLGVAFVLVVDGVRVYFGGDLALWDWDTAREEEKAFTRRFFLESLERVRRAGPVDLAFCNVDPRLPGLGGGVEFVRLVEPRIFVPMHGFGQFGHLLDFKSRVVPTRSLLFLYEKSGDGAEYILDGDQVRLVAGGGR